MKAKNRNFALVLVLLGILLVGASSVAAQGNGPPPKFLGCWEGIDPYDGSLERIVISASGTSGNTYHALYTDYGASICGTDKEGIPLYMGQAHVEFIVDGNELVSEPFYIKCFTRPPFIVSEFPITFGWTYDPTTDMLGNSQRCGLFRKGR